MWIAKAAALGDPIALGANEIDRLAAMKFDNCVGDTYVPARNHRCRITAPVIFLSATKAAHRF